MKQTLIRSWNASEKKFYYFLDGRYYKDEQCKNTISERICLEFTWSNAEWCTGLTDKNGKRIFEGDKLQWYTLKRFTQQSFPECRPEIDELVISKRNEAVVFKNGVFTIDGFIDDEYGFITTIDKIGLYSIEEVMTSIFGENRNNVYEPEEMLTDINGNEINDSILGIEIIGTIHDNTTQP